MILAEYEQLQEVSFLMQEVFITKMQDSYSKDGQISFLKDISLSNLQQRFLNNSKFFLHVENNTIIAVLELEKPSHIAYLFVKKEGFGIAKALCEDAKKEITTDFITVGAYTNAIGFYEKIGFVKIDKEKIFNGFSFTLMTKKINI